LERGDKVDQRRIEFMVLDDFDGRRLLHFLFLLCLLLLNL
jgi:hypothetical protein